MLRYKLRFNLKSETVKIKHEFNDIFYFDIMHLLCLQLFHQRWKLICWVFSFPRSSGAAATLGFDSSTWAPLERREGNTQHLLLHPRTPTSFLQNCSLKVFKNSNGGSGAGTATAVATETKMARQTMRLVIKIPKFKYEVRFSNSPSMSVRTLVVS